MGSREEYALLLKQQRLPQVLAPGVRYQAELLVENVGTKGIHTGVKVTVDQTIRRRSDGQVVLRRSGTQGLTILAGQTKRLPVLISTKDQEGKSLPPGEYLIALNVVRSKLAYLRSRWFTKTLAALTVPITVGEPPARRGTVISTSLPSAIASGGRKSVVVRLRNDGTHVWKPGNTLVSYHWVRVRDHLDVAGEAGPEMAIWGGERAEPPAPVAPGETVSVLVPVSALDAAGDPLDVSGQLRSWQYRIQWDLVGEDEQWFSTTDRPAGEEAVQVVARDGAAVFESVDAPATLAEGERTSIDVIVANDGTRTWRADDDGVIPQWYRWDGRPLDVAVERTRLVADVAPGERALITASLTAPDVPGPYWLAWGMAAHEGARWVTPTDAHASAVTPAFVNPTSLTPVDLTRSLNVAAATTDSYRARGDFDGRGRSLPAEWLPRDHTGPAEPLYPSGYYAPEGRGGRRHGVSVPFSYPEPASGVTGAVACMAQQVPLGEQGVRAVHLAVTSTEGPQEASFGLTYSDGESEATTVLVGAWDQWDGDARLAAYAPYVRTLSEDDATKQAYIYHVTLMPTRATPAVLELPRAPWIKVLAITAETTPQDEGL
jgi:hypothetical protein